MYLYQRIYSIVAVREVRRWHRIDRIVSISRPPQFIISTSTPYKRISDGVRVKNSVSGRRIYMREQGYGVAERVGYQDKECQMKRWGKVQ